MKFYYKKRYLVCHIIQGSATFFLYEREGPKKRIQILTRVTKKLFYLTYTFTVM